MTRRHPDMLWSPALGASWREWTGKRRRLHVVALAIASIVIPASLAVAAPRVARNLVWLASEHPAAVVAAAALFSCYTSSARAARGRSDWARHWTAALPTPEAGIRLYAWILAVAPVLLVGIAVLAFCTSSLVAAAFAGTPDPGSRGVALAAWLGLLAGMSIGMIWKQTGRPTPAPPRSRYVPHSLGHQAADRATLHPLGRWAMREAFACAQPRAAVRAVLPVLLMTPASLSGLPLIFTLLGVTCLLAAGALASGFVVTLRKSRAWVSPLPINPWMALGAAARLTVIALALAVVAGVMLMTEARG